LQHGYHAAGETFAAALQRVALCLKFAEDQPRIPAGNPDGGQWTSGGDGAPSPVDLIGSFLSNLPTVLLAGGFDKEDRGKTVQEAVSETCRGSIYEVLPGQFLDMPIAEVLALANNGDAAARRCKKLLSRGRFKK
jgi:hypothetical protein